MSGMVERNRIRGAKRDAATTTHSGRIFGVLARDGAGEAFPKAEASPRQGARPESAPTPSHVSRARSPRRVVRPDSGLTLIEVLIAVSLLSLLSVGMLVAMRVALNALGRADQKLMDNRRVVGAQRVLESEISGFMPVMAMCGPAPDAPKMRMPFFQGEPQSMRFVSSYSLQGAWRGAPQILEFQVIPGHEGKGVRLIVNEHLYTGPVGAGAFCLGAAPDPVLGMAVPRFPPIISGPQSFVIADRLASCRFVYLEPAIGPLPPQWRPNWILMKWPLAVRIEMVPLEDDPSRLRPVSITVNLRVNRSPEIQYGDY
ncbi:MAG: prepilin-type N-terminal cleavage/methylation domain-containing protein [Acidobacteria bacterium]|nr:prepilin-type N-terminal cleavage/methylation domain-containing protein [Acidobacteriota bacterium]